MDSRGERGHSGRKGRSYLLLSTTVLLWNVAASLLSPSRVSSPSVATPWISALPDRGASSRTEAPVPTASARAGEVSLRHEYLLGKRIDINMASPEEIARLPGISRVTAAAVVAERKRIGRFRSPEDLLRVKGIKGKRLKKILPFLARMENN